MNKKTCFLYLHFFQRVAMMVILELDLVIEEIVNDLKVNFLLIVIQF